MTGQDIVSRFRSGPLLLDGGMGSALIDRGLQGGGSSELWNLERPDDVRAIHAGYLAAGCDVIQTNTFGGSAPALARHGLENKIDEVNRTGARLARDEAEIHAARHGTRPLVAGDMGPSGLLLPPVGDADRGELRDLFAAQASSLAEGGADYIAIETISDREEALCAIRGARQATSLPITACLTFDFKPRGFFTLMGNKPADSMKVLADEGVMAAGANCSIGSAQMIELLSLLLKEAQLPVIVKPNAGMPELVGDRAVYRQSPEDFAADGVKMVQSGAAAIGGCCGTDHLFLQALARSLRTAGLRGKP